MATRSARQAVIGPTIRQSRPAFAPTPRPPAGAPNVLVVVLDDLGFAQLGSYGSDIATPAIDSLAAGGLRYRRFHVTAMCSPTRACRSTRAVVTTSPPARSTAGSWRCSSTSSPAATG